VAFLQPSDIVKDGGGPGFDTAMVAIDRRIPADLGVGKTLGLLFDGKGFDIRAQRTLVALQRQDVVRLLVDDLFRNIALAPRLAIPLGFA
jgi:hypothetical protein